MKTQLLAGAITAALASPAFAIPLTHNGIADSGTGLFQWTDTDGVNDDSGHEIHFHYGSFNSTHTFGIFSYDVDTATIIDTVDIFRDSDHIGASSNLQIDELAGVATSQYGTLDIGFDDYAIGFFFDTEGTFYSLDSLNPSGGDFSGAFFEPVASLENFDLTLMIEDDGIGPITYDRITVEISDIEAWASNGGGGGGGNTVPTPGGIALMSIGLMGMGFSRRFLK